MKSYPAFGNLMRCGGDADLVPARRHVASGTRLHENRTELGVARPFHHAGEGKENIILILAEAADPRHSQRRYVNGILMRMIWRRDPLLTKQTSWPCAAIGRLVRFANPSQKFSPPAGARSSRQVLR